jgi:glucosamine--fructose-6-phosphate aminotransferase (isomerizing)
MGRAAGALTIGITNTPDSVITQETDLNVVIPFKRVGWPTQSSTTGIAALALLALKWKAELGIQDELLESIRTDLYHLPNVVQQIIDTTGTQMANIADAIHQAPVFLFAGGGPAFGAACFGAAKVKELCPVHAISMPLEEYHHYRTQKPGDPIFLVAPPSPSVQRVKDTLLESRRFQGTSIVILERGSESLAPYADYVVRIPDTNKYLTSIPYAIPLQLFSYHLAMAKFRYNEGYPGLRE